MELFAISDYADSLDVMRLVKQYFQELVMITVLMKLWRNRMQYIKVLGKLVSVRMSNEYVMSYREPDYLTGI